MLNRTVAMIAFSIAFNLAVAQPGSTKNFKPAKEPVEEKWAELTVTIRGDNDPIENAQVYIASLEKNNNNSLRTDQNGTVLFERVPVGKVKLHVIATGWKTFGREERLREGKNTLDVSLERMEQES